MLKVVPENSCEVKSCKIIRSLLVGVLAAVVLSGCDQKPSASTDTSRVDAAASLMATGELAGTGAVILNSLPLQTIASLKLEGPTATKGVLVRVRGPVLDARPGEYVVIHDGTGTLFAETHQATLPKAKALVDLSGHLVADGYSVSLKNAVIYLPPAASLSNSETAGLAVRPAKLPRLTKVWEIRDLSPEKAAWQYPVQLKAVVTVVTKLNRYFFAQDDSAGISVRVNEIPTNLNPGDLVKIEGVSDPGGYSPIVLASNVTVLGTASLPEPLSETLFQLASGQDGSQWIEVRGVVRSMAYTNGLARLNLSDPSGMINVNVPAKGVPFELLDATVRIKGACGSTSNEKRQFVSFTLWASSLADVVVEEAGVADPLSLPAQPIASLSQFHPRETLQHRVNVAGIVTYVEPEFFFIQDADTGVRVNAATSSQLKPGDYVMAAGYPRLGDYGFLLNNAVFKVISHRAVPAPQPISVEAPLDPQLHDRWTQTKARLLHQSRIGLVDVLTVQTGNRVFDVRINAGVSGRIKNIQPGSALQITGIYRVLSDEARKPKSLQLAVLSESDIQILEEPTWWTVAHAVTVMAGMGIVIGTTALWVLMLRRKVQEQTASLKQSENKFRSLVEQSLVGVYIIQDERFVYANPRLADIFGYALEEMIGADILEKTILPEDRPLVREQIRRRIAGEVDFSHYFFQGQHQDGNIIHLEVLGSATEFGGRPAVLGMLLDITERKLAHDKIAEQARMLELASDAIMVCDLQDRILYWNKNAQRIFGWTAAQAVGGLAFEKLRIPPVEFAQAKAALLQNHQWHGEFNHQDHHGGELTVAARWTLVHNFAGHPDTILTISTDVTQQKNLETQLLRTQRLDSIGVLAGGIAHDLNNVLAPILMSGQLLEMNPDDPERHKLINTILTSTQRAASLVKQILTFARGTGGQRQVVRPSQVLEELRKILQETLPKSISLRVDSASDVGLIAADTTQLHQVLMNLCLNAQDAMPQGGELTVAVGNVELDKSHIVPGGEAKPGAYVVISVTDNGVGMTAEVRERIFDPFYTTKPFGTSTGLGLSTALGIVKSHGGFIHVQSRLHHGSTFKVYLPAQSGASPVAEKTPLTPRIIRGNNELILVIDDEAPLRNIAKQTLMMFGYRVITANNGAEAVASYTEQQNEIALVFTDMMMPVMDGAAAIQALVQLNPEVKIIAASGRVAEDQIANPAVRAFLPKPYTAESLLTAVHAVLHSQSVATRVAS